MAPLLGDIAALLYYPSLLTECLIEFADRGDVLVVLPATQANGALLHTLLNILGTIIRQSLIFLFRQLKLLLCFDKLRLQFFFTLFLYPN